MRKLALCTVLILTLVSMSFSAMAADTSALVSYDPETKNITLSGYSQGNTIIKTLPSNVDESAVSSSCLPVDIDQIFSEGDFTYTFSMPDYAAYGKYTVYVINNEGKDSDIFMYYDQSQAEAVIPVLNAQTSASGLSSEINSNAATLGVDSGDPLYKSKLNEAGKILFELFMPFSNSGDFYNKFYASLAMVGMNGSSREEIEELMMKYQANLSITYDSDYSSLSDETKDDLCNLLSGLNFKDELKSLETYGKEITFENLLLRLQAVCAVRNAQSWSELKTIFKTEHNDILGVIMTSNDKYNEKIENSVFMKLADSDAFTGFSDLKTKFDQAVKEVLKEGSSNSGTSGSRPGSSGGSSGGSVSVSTGIKAPENQYDEISNEESADGSVKTSFKRPFLTGEKSEYSDILSSDWEYKAVSSLGGNNIIAGYEDGTFRPDNAITRAEFTKLIVSAFDIKANKVDFDDVEKNAWYYPYVSVAAGSEIISGYNGQFNPDAQITREDAAVIIYRVSKKLDKNYYGEVEFADLEETSLYAMTAVRSLGSARIINGDENNNFNPRAPLTRAQAAQIIYNFIKELSK